MGAMADEGKTENQALESKSWSDYWRRERETTKSCCYRFLWQLRLPFTHLLSRRYWFKMPAVKMRKKSVPRSRKTKTRRRFDDVVFLNFFVSILFLGDFKLVDKVARDRKFRPDRRIESIFSALSALLRRASSISSADRKTCGPLVKSAFNECTRACVYVHLGPSRSLFARS